MTTHVNLSLLTCVASHSAADWNKRLVVWKVNSMISNEQLLTRYFYNCDLEFVHQLAAQIKNSRLRRFRYNSPGDLQFSGGVFNCLVNVPDRMNIPTDLCSNRIGTLNTVRTLQQLFRCKHLVVWKVNSMILYVIFDGMCMRHVYIHAGE